MINESFRSRVRAGVIWSLIQNWGMRLGGLVVFTILARVLSPAELGLFAAATTVVAFCGIFVESGLSEAVVQRESVSNSQLNTVFLINILLAFLAVIVLWLGAKTIASYMRLPELEWILRLSSLSILVGALAFAQNAMQRRRFRYKFLARVSILATIVSGLVAFGMAFSGWGAWSLVGQSLLFSVVTTALLWRDPQWRLSLVWDIKETSGLLQYGAHRLTTTLLDFANTRFIEFFFAMIFGATALGVYVVGTRIYQSLLQILCSSILDVAHNTFSRLALNRDAVQAAYYRATNISSVVVAPIFVCSAALAPEVTRVLFGIKWSASAGVMEIMLILGAVQSLQYYNGIVCNALGKPKIGMYLVVGKALITAITLVLVRDQDLQSVVGYFAAAQLLMTPVSFYSVWRVAGISPFTIVSNIWPFLVAMGVSFCTSKVLRSHGMLGAESSLVAMPIVVACSYILVAVLLGRSRLAEVWRIVRNRGDESNSRGEVC